MNKKTLKLNKYLNPSSKRILSGILLLAMILEFGFPHASFGETIIHSNEPGDKEPELILVEAPRGFSPLSYEKYEKKEQQIIRAGHVWVTAYSSSEDQTDSSPFITANGKHVYNGLVASNFLTFGTKIRFPDYFGEKIFTVNDRMHPRFNHRMDIWMGSRDEALLFGKRKLKYEILEKF